LDQNFEIIGDLDELRELQVLKHKKLPKNFANQVLDLELKIDSGRFDLDCINKLMQLYSVSKLNHFWKNKFWIASSGILLWHEWWEIYVFYRAYSKHIAQNWSA